MQTEVTRLLGIEYPIIQGGMAWVAEYHLAAGVSEAGGLGLIGAASAPADWVHLYFLIGTRNRLSVAIRSGTQGKRTDRQTVRCQHHADESLCR